MTVKVGLILKNAIINITFTKNVNTTAQTGVLDGDIETSENEEARE